MSRESQKTTENLIKTLEEALERTPYKLNEELSKEADPLIKDDVILSVIIPARNEFPNVVHTVHNILAIWEADGFNIKDLEIIIVDNCSTDTELDRPATRGTTTYLEARGLYHSRILRILRDPIAGNHSARNKGAAMARGKYLFFSDAHMSYAPGTFKYLIETTEKYGGMVHAAIAWMGAYRHGIGYQYTIKLGDEIRGTWANYQVSDQPFYISSLGHCSVMISRKEFWSDKCPRYPVYHRTYGGGEFFWNWGMWMTGSTVMVDPRAVGHHLAAGRGYTYHSDDLKHNVFNCAYALGMDDWLERNYIDWLRRGRKEVLDRMMAEAKKEMAETRIRIERHRVMTFNEMLVRKPWDEMNMKLHGRKNSSMLIYHDSWLPSLNRTPAKEVYENSPTQKELEKFINENLSQYVYKRVHPTVKPA